MKSRHRQFLGACIRTSACAMVLATSISAADHRPAVAERKPFVQDSDVIRRYGSSAFRKAAGQLAFSPNGRWLAAADARSVVLFDAKTGQSHLNCEVAFSNLSGFAFSPDGNSIAIADPRGLSIWDIQNGAVSARLEGEDKTRLTHGQFCAASPDRQWRVNHASQELALARWDQLEPVKKIPFRDYFPSVAIGNEGQWIAAAGRQGNAAPAVRIWQSPEFDSSVEWKHKTAVRCLAASPDGEILYAGVGDRMVHAWNIKERRESLHFQIDSSFWPVSMAVSPDGKLLAVACSRSVTTYEANTGRLVHKIDWVEQVSGVGLAFAPDGRTLAICPSNRSVEIWDVKTGQPIYQPGPSIENVFATRDSALFGSFTEGLVHFWNPTSGKLEESFPLYPWSKEETAPPGESLFHGTEQLIINQPGGEVLYRNLALGQKTFEGLGKLSTEAMFSGYNKHAVKVHSIGPGAFLLSVSSLGMPGAQPRNLAALLDVSPSECLDVKLAAEGTVLAAAFADKSVFIWDTATSKQQHKLNFEQSPKRVFLNSTGEWLAVSQGDFIAVWDLKAGKPIHLLETPQTKVHAIAFGSKQNLLAAAVPGKPIQIWNLTTGKEIVVLPAPDFPAESMAFSPDDKRLAVGYQDKTIGVFDLDTKEETQVLEGHKAPVTHLKFHPDGSRLVSASQTPEVLIWDTTTGKQISSKSPLRSGIQQLDWVADGKEVLVVDQDHFFLRFLADRDHVESYHSSSRAMRPLSFAYCPDRGFLAVGYDRGVRILNQTTGQEQPFLRLKLGANHLAWSSDGRVLMIGSEDLFGWDVDRQKEAYRIAAPASQYESRVGSMARSPDGRFVATAHSGRLLCIWDPQTGTLVRKIENPNVAMTQNLRFSRDGRLLFALSPSWFHVIEVESGLIWFQKPNEVSRDTSFAPLDKWTILSGEPAGSARLWTWAPANEGKKRQSPEELWESLYAFEGPTIYQAMFALVDQGDETVEILDHRFPMEPVPAEKVNSLIKNLEDDSPTVRRTASEELRKLGSPTRPHLEAALEDEGTSPRLRMRIKLLLSALDLAVSRELMAARAIQLLEWIDTPKARALIQKWANKPDEPLRREAQGALGRLSQSTSLPGK